LNTQNEIIKPEEFAMRALTRAPMSVVLTNPRLEDNPVVYVNAAFETITGYSQEAAIGRNCRFLQGDDTDPKELARLKNAIKNETEISVDLKNYRADGTAFINRLMISPLTNDDGEVEFFMGVQLAIDADGTIDGERLRREATERVLSELQHRVKNHLSLIVGMIRLQARGSQAATDDFSTLSRRIEALQLLYEEMGDTRATNANDASVAVGAYVSRIANAIAYIDGRSGIRVNIDADAVSVPFETATRIGLVVSEILTNALQHAFKGRDAGIVELRLKMLSQGVMRITITDDGDGMPEGSEWPENGNLGSRIVRDLLSELDATLSVQTENQGTTIAFDVPHKMTE